MTRSVAVTLVHCLILIIRKTVRIIWLQNFIKKIIIYRKSFPLQKSHAEAWQTTWRLSGFSIKDSFQNSSGIGINPNDVKNSSDTWNILSGVYP